jgi:hypothetical protein
MKAQLISAAIEQADRQPSRASYIYSPPSNEARRTVLTEEDIVGLRLRFARENRG